MTHLQHAQPVTFGHWLLAHVQPLLRDLDRLRDWDARTAVSPLGAGALAGSSLPLDPAGVAKELGFTAPAANSMDAVADRDFVAEFLFITALIGVHLSRLGEEVVLWTSQEFGWVELDDAFATGSSIMPQKKNADIAELARGKSGRLVGGLMAVLTMLKGLPMAYDRDMQEDKEPAFDAVDTLELLLPALAGMISTMTVRVDRLVAATPVGFSLATEVADWLVRKGVPFREAHEMTGKLVALCAVRECELDEVSDEDLALVSEHLDPSGARRALGPLRRWPPGPRRARPAPARSPTSSPRSPSSSPAGGSGRRRSSYPADRDTRYLRPPARPRSRGPRRRPFALLARPGLGAVSMRYQAAIPCRTTTSGIHEIDIE